MYDANAYTGRISGAHVALPMSSAGSSAPHRYIFMYGVFLILTLKSRESGMMRAPLTISTPQLTDFSR